MAQGHRSESQEQMQSCVSCRDYYRGFSISMLLVYNRQPLMKEIITLDEDESGRRRRLFGLMEERYLQRVSISILLFYWKGGANIVRGNPEISMKRDRDASCEFCGFPSVKCALGSRLKECVNAKKHV